MRKSLLKSFYILAVVFIFSSICFSQVPKSKGKYTKEIKTPKIAHMTSELVGGKFRRLRGKLYIGKFEVPESSIISVYKITDNNSKFLFSYLVGADGKFDFKKLKAGTYFLMTGTTDGVFNQNNIKIILAPNDKDSSEEEIEIFLEVGT